MKKNSLMRLKNIKWIGAMTLSILFVLYTLQSCNEYTTLGGDIVSDLNKVEVLKTDTFTIKTRSTRQNQDSVYPQQINYVALGTLNADPIFGNIIGELYTQFGLAQPGEEFSGSNLTLDSIILSLRFSGYYGDSLSNQTYTVYRIDDPDFSDNTLRYYKHQQFHVDKANPLGHITINADMVSDSTQVVHQKQPAQLRIRLSNSFGNELLSKTPDDALADDSVFHQWLNGIAIFPDSTTAGKKSMIYYSLNNKFTGLSVFYHNDEEDSLFAYFPFKARTSAWANYLHHDYAGTPVEQALQKNTTTDSIVYLQTNSGLYTDIFLPYLDEIDSILINKAELVITQIADPSNKLFSPPYELFLWKFANEAKDSVGYLIDVGASFSAYQGWRFTNLAYFGGLRQKITNKEGKIVARYRFNIARYIQQIINAPDGSKHNYGLRLGVWDPLNRGPNIGRVSLGGANHSAYRMKLKVVYTKIK